MRIRVLRVALLAAALAIPLGAAAPAHAALPVDADPLSPAQVTEVAGTIDGIRAQGDTLEITQTIIASGTATDMSATLTSSTLGVTVVQPTSSYPDLVNGATAANDVPFRVQLDAMVPCGETLRLTLSVTGDQGTVQIPIHVATGAAGPYANLAATHVPRAIPIEGAVESNLEVTQAGRVKGLRVHIGQLDHTYVGDLRIWLVAPDNRSALLFDQSGGSGQHMRDVTFVASGGSPAGSLVPPYAGATINAPALASLDGVQTAGQWRLRIDDRKLSDSGTLHAWDLDLASAVCDGRPVASFTATPNPVLPDHNVTFDATGSTDPTEPIDLYEWDLDGDGEFDDETGARVTTSYPAPQRVDVRVRVWAGEESDDATVPVAVTVPPVAALQASRTTPLTGEQVTLDASGSRDAEGPIERYLFDLQGDGTFEVDNGASPTLTTSWAEAGAHTVRVKVIDGHGAEAIAGIVVSVANRPPTATLVAFPTPAIAGETTTLQSTDEHDPDGNVVGHDWDLDGDGSYDAFTGEVAYFDHVFATAGTKTVRLRIRDDDGGSAVVSLRFVVTRPPVAAVTATPNPVSFGQTVTLSASASTDPDGAALAKYEWDFADDGTDAYDRTTTVPTTTTSYPTAGTRTVRVRVTDADGATAVATATVTVRNVLPIAVLSATPTAPATGAPVALSAEGSSDPDGTVVVYQWDLDGDGSFERSTGPTPRTSTSYPNAGNVRVRVRVTDDDGGTSVRVADLTVVTPPAGTPDATPGETPGAGAGTGGSDAPPGAAPTPGEPAGSDPAGGDAGEGPAGLAATLGGPPLQRLRAVARSGLRLSCRANFDGRCVLDAFVRKADARRLGVNRRARRDVRIGRASAVLTGDRPATVRLRLSAAARRAARRSRRGLRVVVRGFARDGSSRRVALSRVVLVRR